MLLLSGALAGTAAVGYAQMSGYKATDLLNTEAGRSFMVVLDQLNANYLYDVDREAVMRGAIHGALGALKDDFTYYEEPSDNAIDRQNLSGTFYGIGVLLEGDRSGRGVRVGTVYQGGAAFEAGVQMGDVFLEIDGKDVRDSTTTDVVRLVRGEEGKPVQVMFARGGKPYTVTMTRKPVSNVSVETAILDGNVGYIALTSFYNEKASAQFREAVRKMQAAGVNKLIVDMRDNGGGLLQAGVDVADQFMNEGPIVSLRNRSGRTQLYGAATDRGTDYEGELVVLVNRNSASASEVVSGALQDVGRAQIIGEKTFGKGVAQTPITTPDGGRVNIVSSEWVSPGGRRINKEGITPDVLVKDSRRFTPLNFIGSGAQPGTEMILTVNGEEVKVQANSEGQFEYVGELPRRERSSVPGEATVDLESDQQLRAALEYFATGAVSKDLQMTPEEIAAQDEARATEDGEDAAAEDTQDAEPQPQTPVKP